MSIVTVDPAFDWGHTEPAATIGAVAVDPRLLDIYATSLQPAYDWGQVQLLELHAQALDPTVVTPPPPPLYPDDPDGPPGLPEPAARGHLIEVWACRPISHQPIAQFTTAVVDSWSMDWDGGDADITVSAWDPAWGLVSDLDGFEIMIGVDGGLVWSGVCNQPIDIGDGLVSIPASNPMVILDQNTLGNVEQPDLYHHAGRFNAGAAGWTRLHDPKHGFICQPLFGFGHSTFDPWEGSGCLSLIGVGWVAGPWVNLPGHPGRVRHPIGSAMLKCPSGALGFEVQVKDGDGYVRPDFARANAATVDPDTGWQGLATAKGWLPSNAPVRIAVAVASKDTCYIDFARITWGTLSGSTVPIPLSSYPAIIVSDAQNTSIGGHPYGIAVAVDSAVDARAKRAWAHADNHPVSGVLAEIADMYGGPDIWMDERFTVHVARRRGTVRADIMLDEHTVIVPAWAQDPGARVNELIGLTEFGSGATRAAVGAAQGTSGYNHRQTTQTPAGMDYDTAKEWITGLAGKAGRPQVTGSVDVRWDDARRLNVGDSVQAPMVQGRLTLGGWVRITNVRMNPDAWTGTITFGVDGDL